MVVRNLFQDGLNRLQFSQSVVLGIRFHLLGFCVEPQLVVTVQICELSSVVKRRPDALKQRRKFLMLRICRVVVRGVGLLLSICIRHRLDSHVGDARFAIVKIPMEVVESFGQVEDARPRGLGDHEFDDIRIASFSIGSSWIVTAICRPPAGFNSYGVVFGSGAREIEIKGNRRGLDRKSTRLNSSHPSISYAVFCLKKKKKATLSFHAISLCVSHSQLAALAKSSCLVRVAPL